MKKIIDSILNKYFCCHNWEIFHKYETFATDNTDELPTRTIIHILCTKCGKIKKLL